MDGLLCTSLDRCFTYGVIASMLSRCFGELKSAHESHLLPIISRISASELARFEIREGKKLKLCH